MIYIKPIKYIKMLYSVPHYRKYVFRIEKHPNTYIVFLLGNGVDAKYISWGIVRALRMTFDSINWMFNLLRIKY